MKVSPGAAVGDTSRRAACDTSLTPAVDTSLETSLDAGADTSLTAAADMSRLEPRLCQWCGASLVDVRQVFCSKRCRQTAFRARKLAVCEDHDGTRKRLKYADPPYPGLSRKYYRDEPTFAGEVDHVELIASLRASSDGWALSTSAKALRNLLPLCPPTVRVGVWLKINHPCPATRGIHGLWEAVIVQPARLRRPPVEDYLIAKPARGGGSKLKGRKPIAFCMWLFRLMGASPLDEFDDLFPGSGVVAAAWRQFQEVNA